MFQSFRRHASRLAAAITGATKGEVAKITEGLNEAIDAHLDKPSFDPSLYLVDDIKPGPVSYSREARTHKDGPRAVRRRRNRFRCSRNKKFHAKRGGQLQFGHVAHDMANNTLMNSIQNKHVAAIMTHHAGLEYKPSKVLAYRDMAGEVIYCDSSHDTLPTMERRAA